MSEAKHTPTPGPWELEAEGGGIRDEYGSLIASLQFHGNVNTILRCGELYNAADGHLIAAAPELLAVCVDMRQRLNAMAMLAQAAGVRYDAAQCRTMVDQLDAVLAKAHGAA